MLADDLQDLSDVDVDSLAVPPLFLTVVTGEEADFRAVRQEMFDLDHVRLRALGAVHIGFRCWLGWPHATTSPDLRQRALLQQTPDITATPSPLLGPIGVPVRAMGTSGATGLPTSDSLLAEAHLGMIVGDECAGPLQLGPGKDQEASQIMLIEVFDRVEQIAVKCHHATDNGAKSLVTVRRSVRVQPCGGIIRS